MAENAPDAFADLAPPDAFADITPEITHPPAPGAGGPEYHEEPSFDDTAQGAREAAARRMRRAVQPEGGRTEGPTTYVMEHLLPDIVSEEGPLSPKGVMEGARGLQESGEFYGPA